MKWVHAAVILLKVKETCRSGATRIGLDVACDSNKNARHVLVAKELDNNGALWSPRSKRDAVACNGSSNKLRSEIAETEKVKKKRPRDRTETAAGEQVQIF